IHQAERSVAQRKASVRIAPLAACPRHVERDGVQLHVRAGETSREALADPRTQVFDGKGAGGVGWAERDPNLARRDRTRVSEADRPAADGDRGFAERTGDVECWRSGGDAQA